MQKGKADGGFLRGRLAITGRAPVHDIRNVNILPGQSDRGEHPVQQLAGATNKGQALAVLVGARRLADEHDSGGWIAIRKDQIGGMPLQFAALEIGQRGF